MMIVMMIVMMILGFLYDERGYERYPEYKCFFFMDTNEPDYRNDFSVLDYEMYAHT